MEFYINMFKYFGGNPNSVVNNKLYQNKNISYIEGEFATKYFTRSHEVGLVDSETDNVDFVELMGYFPKPEFSILLVSEGNSALYVLNKDFEERFKSTTMMNINIWVGDNRHMLIDIPNKSEAALFALSYVDGDIIFKKED